MTDWLFIVYVVVAWGHAPSYPVVRPSEAFCQAERERFIAAELRESPFTPEQIIPAPAVRHVTPCMEADAWQ